jgi:hypothetical protein
VPGCRSSHSSTRSAWPAIYRGAKGAEPQ